MIITITGKEGSGKSSIAKRLSQVLGFKRYYIGDFYRRLAVEKNGSLLKTNEAESKQDADLAVNTAVDNEITRLALEEDNIIIEGRTALQFARKPAKERSILLLNLYFEVDNDVGAKRVYKSSLEESRAPGEPVYASIEHAANAIKERFSLDREKYIRLYGEDLHDSSLYDIVADSSKLSIDEQFDDVKRKIVDFLTNAEIGEDVVKALSN